jgi:tetratricopeptide (TPR) repeat protein
MQYVDAEIDVAKAQCAPNGESVMKRSSLFRLFLVLVSLAAFLTACSRDPNVRKQKYFESGQRYYAEGKYREAVIQFRNATQVDSTFAAAHYQLAQAYLKVQDWQHAYTELGRTLELQSDNYKAQVDIANLLIAGNELKMAQEHTDVLAEKQPNDPDTHIVLANLFAAQHRFDDATAETRKAILLAPDRGDSYVNLALLETKLNQPDAAETHFKKAIDLKATTVNPHLALAAFYQSRGRYPEAEQQVQTVITADPKDTDSRASLAKLYLAEGKRPEAEVFLKQVKNEMPDVSAAYRMLGDFYFAIGDLDKAVGEYESLYNDHRKDSQVQKNYVQLLILKNRLDEADKINEAVLKTAAKDDEALTYRGEIQIGRGKLSDATQTLQSAITNNPYNAVAHYQLGLALNQLGNLDRAGAEWQEAARLKPDMIEAQRGLAGVALQKSDMSGLEQAATKIVTLQPASPDGYALRAISLMARKQYPAAEQDARKAMEVAPQSAPGYLQMGNLRTLELKSSEAETWYKQALSRDPNSVDALRGLMNIYLAQKHPEKAIATAKAQIAAAPNNTVFYDLLGSALLAQKNYGEAETALKKAVEINKNNWDAYAKLGQAQTSKGAVDEALATYNAGAAANPMVPVFQLLMGGVYETKHDLEKAKNAYQTALQIKPEDPSASNNLAYVLLETNGNADIALQLAQTARRGLPESSNVADTLGWAFYQKGVYQSAISMFQEAIKLAAKNKEADSAVYHYHLGMAYAKSEQPALARQHFERVLKIDPKYSDAEDVKKQLAQLRS